MSRLPVRFHHAKVPGGGFVTGFVFHPTEKNILYARTDIGGAYRYDFAKKEWVSLADGVPHPCHFQTYPLSIALSCQFPDYLYMAAGDREVNKLCVSKDRGESFEYFDIPTSVHGNAPGRGTGERLCVSRYDADHIWFASQTGGLFETADGGKHFKSVDVMGETNLTLLFVHPENEAFMIVGTNGYANRSAENLRGDSLYYSVNGGETFAVMPHQPKAYLDDEATIGGFVAQRTAFDGRYLYVSYNMPKDCWRGFDSYACDTGTSFDGALLRYELSANGAVLSAKDITPKGNAARLGFGLSGVNVDSNQNGVLYVSSICKRPADVILMSKDKGETFVPILDDLSIGHIDFTVPYMKPPYNGNHSIVHWMADLKVDPHNGDFALFTTGTGIFATFNLTDALKGETVSWEPLCAGLEETVHLNVYSPPTGDVQLLDIIGDLGGFAFKNLEKPCENSFADERGNRYITCMNADFLDSHYAPVCVTARGNWTGHTKGGLIVSDDDCDSWTRLPMPFGITPLIDSLLNQIEKPNTNPGWTAVSADGETILWCVGKQNSLPITAVCRTADRGLNWERCVVYDRQGKEIADDAQTMKVFSDRVNPRVFYGFGKEMALFVSVDGGRTFAMKETLGALAPIDVTGIDGQQHYEIRPMLFHAGVFYVSMKEHGLARIRYDFEGDCFKAQAVLQPGDTVYRVGLGKAMADGGPQTLYINGILDGVYGFYASFDNAKTWALIGDERHMYGDIRSIAGDMRRFGRFYLATGSRGALWGDIIFSQDA